MDYTVNYHLPQWVESDRILMEDFNEAMAGIDTGIKSAQDTADSGAAAASAPRMGQTVLASWSRSAMTPLESGG